MTSKDDFEKAGGPHDPARLLDIAYFNSAELIFAIEEYKIALEEGADPTEIETRKRLTDARKSIQIAFEERNRFDEIAARYGYGGDETDYDALRSEIGRRLDELRAARDAEEVPGGSE